MVANLDLVRSVVHTFRDGRIILDANIIRSEDYLSHMEALKAVGLKE